MATTQQPASQPDERVFRTHIEGGAFQSGADRGRWRLERITWPFAFCWVSAAPRGDSPSEYAFRFQVDNYPVFAPIGRCWDLAADTPLAFPKRPWGTGRVEIAFRTNWQSDSCLYLACDRTALAAHEGWRTQYSPMIWISSSDITLYLRTLHDLLHSRDYTGVLGT